jgi:hypothetical protein
MSKKSKSVWGWIGCGCGGLVLLTLGGVVAAFVSGQRYLSDYVEDLQDPVARLGRVEEILGAEQLPTDFRPQLFFRVPWVLDMVVLSDGEEAEYNEQGNSELKAEHLGENAFVFLSIRDLGDTREDMEAIFAGETPKGQLDIDLDFRSQESLGRGELDVGTQHLRWAAHRGTFGDRRDSPDGIYSFLLVDCPEADDRVRVAFYWQSRKGELSEPLDLTGTPADEATLAAFMGHFKLCGE